MTNLCVAFQEKVALYHGLIFFRFKHCSILVELTYLTLQAICTCSPVDTVQMSSLHFLALFIPLTPFSVNRTYKLVSLRIIFKQQILKSSSMLLSVLQYSQKSRFKSMMFTQVFYLPLWRTTAKYENNKHDGKT